MSEHKRPIDMLADEYLDRQKATSERIAELHAHVTRLQKAFKSLAAEYGATVKAEYSYQHGLDELADMHGLQPGDLEGDR